MPLVGAQVGTEEGWKPGLGKTFVGDDNVLEIYISAGDDDIEIFDEQLNENVETRTSLLCFYGGVT